VVLAIALALGLVVSVASSTSADLVSASPSCPLSGGCEALLGYAGTTPTSPTIGTTTTVFLLGKYGIGGSPDLVLTGPGVHESLAVEATAITKLPSGGLSAYNPQYAGPTPNAASHADDPGGCAYGTSNCLWELSFTIPATGLPANEVYTATLTAFGSNGAGNQVAWRVPFGSVDSPFDPALGSFLGALVLGSLLLFRINRRRPITAA